MVVKKVVCIRGVNPYVLIEETEARQLQVDWKKPMPVLIQVNGQPETPWQINMMPVGNGDFYLYLHGDVREASNVKVGDTVELSILFDKGYKNGPMHPMPDWFEKALDKHKDAKANWDVLPPSRQKEILRYFSRLKSEEAKRRNKQRVMEVLSGMPVRFMGRDWKDGR